MLPPTESIKLHFIPAYALFALLVLAFVPMRSFGQIITPTAFDIDPVCFPSGVCEDDDGKFVTITRGLFSLGDVGETQNVFNVSLDVPADLDEFQIRVFDGEMGGKWDRLPVGIPDTLTFKLFPDPNLEGNTNPADLLYSWPASAMLDNGWCALDTTGGCQLSAAHLPRDNGACPDFPNGSCFYHFIVEWDTTNNTNEQNVFKLEVEGVPFLLAGSSVGFEGFGCDDGSGNCSVSVPGFLDFDPTTFDGNFVFKFLVPEEEAVLTLYDGDFDTVDEDFGLNTGDSVTSPNCDPWIRMLPETPWIATPTAPQPSTISTSSTRSSSWTRI